MFPPVLILVPFYTLIIQIHLTDSYLGIILSHTILALPFCVWMLKSYMDSVPSALIEAGLVDGCSRLGTFARIVLPTSLSGLAVVAFFAFVVSWGDYLMVSVISGTDNTATMPLYLYRATSSLQLSWGNVATGAAGHEHPAGNRHSVRLRAALAGQGSAGGRREGLAWNTSGPLALTYGVGVAAFSYR